MQLVKFSPAMGPAAGQYHTVIAAVRSGELVIGTVPVHLKDTPIATQMPGDPVAGAAIFEAIRDHRRTTATEGSVISGIGPKPGRLGRSRSARERGQRRLVSEDPLRRLDLGEDVVGQDIDLEAELAHPLGHQLPVKLDLVAGVDCLLSIERKAIGILRDRDLGEKRFRRNAALDDMRGRGSLDAPFSFLKAYFGRRVTMTRKFAGTASSRSDTSSPISTFCLPTRSGSSSGSITTSTRSR